MAMCAVEGCSSRADEVFVWREAPSVQFLVCLEHHLHIAAGERVVVNVEKGSLVLGEHPPQRLIAWRIDTHRSPPSLELSIGRDGVVTRSISLPVTHDVVERMRAELLPSMEAMLRRDTDGNA